MLKKLDGILQRYAFLSEKLADSETIADMSVWQKYSKEQAELAETAQKYEEYLETERQMQDAFEILLNYIEFVVHHLDEVEQPQMVLDNLLLLVLLA